jgi:hypothetical protein
MLGQTDFLPMGLSPYPSQQAYMLMNTPVGRELLSTAISVLTNRYNMKPVGGETQSALINRTALLFVQQFGESSVDGSELQTIVAFVSPLSEHKSATEILAGGSGGFLTKRNLLIGGAVLAGVILLVAFLRKGKKESMPPTYLGEGI